MRIIELYKARKPVISFEIFPPKASVPLESLYQSLEAFKKLGPDYISVTYGAGGGQRGRTVEITQKLKDEYGIEGMAHLTCVGHSCQEIDAMLDSLHEKGLDNILALRGDPPADSPDFDFGKSSFRYASELIKHIRGKNRFCIAAAAYLEGHMDCKRLKEDIVNLKKKVEAGTDFLLTQLFFDNRLYYEFLDRASAIGISCPVIPGIMPILKAEQIKAITAKSGCSIPARLVLMMDRFQDSPEDLSKAGIEYAAAQIRDLLDNGAQGIHLYTMNRPKSTYQILDSASLLKNGRLSGKGRTSHKNRVLLQR